MDCSSQPAPWLAESPCMCSLCSVRWRAHVCCGSRTQRERRREQQRERGGGRRTSQQASEHVLHAACPSQPCSSEFFFNFDWTRQTTVRYAKWACQVLLAKLAKILHPTRILHFKGRVRITALLLRSFAALAHCLSLSPRQTSSYVHISSHHGDSDKHAGFYGAWRASSVLAIACMCTWCMG